MRCVFDCIPTIDQNTKHNLFTLLKHLARWIASKSVCLISGAGPTKPPWSSFSCTRVWFMYVDHVPGPVKGVLNGDPPLVLDWSIGEGAVEVLLKAYSICQR